MFVLDIDDNQDFYYEMDGLVITSWMKDALG